MDEILVPEVHDNTADIRAVLALTCIVCQADIVSSHFGIVLKVFSSKLLFGLSLLPGEVEVDVKMRVSESE